MKQANKAILSGTISGTTVINGSQIDSNQLLYLSAQIVCSHSSVEGTLKLQVSNDVAQVGPTPFTVTNWVDLPNQSASITSGGSKILTVTQMTYRWIRAVFTPSAGDAKTVVVNMFAMSA